MMRVVAFLSLFVEAFKEWRDDKAPRLAAALAYYTIFSVAPILLILVAIAGRILGEEAASGEIIERTQNIVGEEVAGVLQTVIRNASQPTTNRVATIVSVGTIIWSASNIFNQLYEALNTIWGVYTEGKPRIIDVIKARFLAFAIVIVAGLLLIIYLALSTTLASVIPIAVVLVEDNLLTGIVDIERFLPAFRLIQVAEFIVTFGVITVLLALIYKVLPDAQVTWRDVWVGAAMTSLLLGLGRLLISLYMGQTTIGSTFGAAGSLLVFLLWVYLVAQIFLYGAEFTHVYANRFGSNIRPPSHVTEAADEEESKESRRAAEAPPLSEPETAQT